MTEKTKVLIVDDSVVVRKTLTEIIESDPDLTVLGVAADPYQAVEIMRSHRPDVITLDLHMPRMDGLTFLQKIMAQHPIPVVVCSSMVEESADVSMLALAYGAVDVIAKPQVGSRHFLEEARIMICDTVKAAAQAQSKSFNEQAKHQNASLRTNRHANFPPARIIVAGASTGGTEALAVFLEAMPENAPGIVIVQHMPEKFTTSYAQRLDSICRIDVAEAESSMAVTPGLALIAPGGKHVLLRGRPGQYFVEVRDGPLVNRHRPSVDVLFKSAARAAGHHALGVIMTGMGNDGAQGMKEMHDKGARTFAQNKESCVVFGMPGEAIALGGVDQVLPLRLLVPAMLKTASQPK